MFVVQLPVGVGKSLIAQTVAAWSARTKNSPAITLAPNNLLVDQYVKDFPSLHVLRGKKHYWCDNLKMTLEERAHVGKEKLCSEFLHCAGCNRYRWVLKRNWTSDKMLANNHVYVSHRLAKRYSTVLVDEAHNLVPMLQEMGQRVIWRHQLPAEVQYPLNIKSTTDLAEWLRELPDSLVNGKKAKKWQHFLECVGSDNYLFKAGYEEYHGEERHCLKLLPIDIRDEPKIFFPSSVKKIVLLSATIGPKDIEQLGLYTKKVKYLSAPSPIPVERRPIISLASSVSMAYRDQNQNLAALVSEIRNILSYHHDNKGLIHAPYSLAAKIRQEWLRQTGDVERERMMFHTSENKKQVYQEFRAATGPAVLLASGMYEGVDLPYDAARFQIITKVPYPSLAEPAIAHRAAKDEEWYQWETQKVLMQSFGRVVRASDDYGITYLLDSSFRVLYKKAGAMMPEWLRESIILEKE